MRTTAGRPHHADRANSTRLALLWAGVRDSLWFLPTLCTLGAVLLALLIVRLDARWEAEGALGGVLFSGGAEGARGVLTAVAGSLITVTGVVFSVTVVALQLASSQFTPRVLRGFMADRANQIVLGIFIGTFTYTVMVLRTVTAGDDTGPAFVPEVGVTLTILLVLVSIGALIYFINHAARSIQAAVILAREAAHTLHRIDHLFPQDVGHDEGFAAPEAPTAPAATVLAEKSGYLLAVHAQGLFELAEHHRMTVRMEPAIGAFVLPGEPLASVWPATAVNDELADAVREAFLLGEERTPEQDAELGITVIADMAVRALSPGINDPTTAMLCIDRLMEILARLGRAPEPAASRLGTDGAVRFLARLTTFERGVGLAFDQIRHHGGGNPSIAKKLVDAQRRLGALVPRRHRAVLVRQAELALASVRLAAIPDGDLAAVERVAAACLEVLRGDAASPASSAGSSPPRASKATLTRR
jgi:uncharacterized membrane protein